MNEKCAVNIMADFTSLRSEVKPYQLTESPPLVQLNLNGPDGTKEVQYRGTNNGPKLYYDVNGNPDYSGEYDKKGNKIRDTNRNEGPYSGGHNYDKYGHQIKPSNVNNNGYDEYGHRISNQMGGDNSDWTKQWKMKLNGVTDVNGEKVKYSGHGNYDGKGNYDPNGKYDKTMQYDNQYSFNREGQYDPNGKYDMSGNKLYRGGQSIPTPSITQTTTTTTATPKHYVAQTTTTTATPKPYVAQSTTPSPYLSQPTSSWASDLLNQTTNQFSTSATNYVNQSLEGVKNSLQDLINTSLGKLSGTTPVTGGDDKITETKTITQTPKSTEMHKTTETPVGKTTETTKTTIQGGAKKTTERNTESKRDYSRKTFDDMDYLDGGQLFGGAGNNPYMNNLQLIIRKMQEDQHIADLNLRQTQKTKLAAAVIRDAQSEVQDPKDYVQVMDAANRLLRDNKDKYRKMAKEIQNEAGSTSKKSTEKTDETD